MPNTKQTKKSKFNPLIGTLSLEQVMDNLDFSEEEVEHAARTLPKLWLEAAQQRVRIMRTRHQKSAALDVEKVDAATSIRADALSSGTKITEKAVAEQVEGDQGVRDALQAFSDAQVMEEFAKLMLEAIRMKKSAIQVVADSHKGEAGMGHMADAAETVGTLDAMKGKLKRKYSRTNAV